MKKGIILIILSFILMVSICPVAQASGNDPTPPELLSVSLNKTEFAVGETVVVTIVAKDDETGLDIAPCWVGIGQNDTGCYCYALKSTDVPDTYTARWTISDSTKTGVYYVNRVYLKNNGMIDCQYSTYTGTLSNEFQFNVTNDVRTDWTGPTLDELTVDRTIANVGDTVTFSVKASDPSDIQTIYMFLYFNGVQNQTIYLKKDINNPGYFTGKFTVTSSFNEGNYTVGGVFLIDGLGNSSKYTTTDGSLPESMRYNINIINPDVTPPPGPVIIENIDIITPQLKQGDPLTVQMQVDANRYKSFGPIDLGYQYPNQGFFNDTAIRLNRKLDNSDMFEGTQIIPPNYPTAKYTLSSCYIWQNIPYDYLSFLNQRKSFVVDSVFSGTENCSVTIGNEFDPMAGVSAGNNTEGDMTSKIVVTGAVDTSKVGLYLIRYMIPSEYKRNIDDTKQYYYYDFRWVGVTEALPSDSADSPIVLTDGDVIIDVGVNEVTLKKDNDVINYTSLVTNEGHYTVVLSDPNSTNSNTKQSVSFNIDKSAPEISLNQTHNPDRTTRVEVYAHDISEVVLFKWATGERDASYFRENGQTFGGVFNATSFGKYTIYVEDLLGNASTKVIDVEPAEYIVSVLSADPAYGTVEGGGTCSKGVPVTVKATPKTDCRFTKWMEDGIEVSKVADYTFTPATDRALVAQFVKIDTPVISAITCPSYNIVKLDWGAIDGATGYWVYRATSSNGGYTKIPVNVTGTSYIDTVPKWGITYYYKVRAYCTTTSAITTYGSQSSYKSARTNWVTPVLTASMLNYHSINLNWNDVPGADYYRVYRCTSSTGTYTRIAEKVYVTSYTDDAALPSSGMAINKVYYYKVQPVDAEGGAQGVGPHSIYKSAKASWEKLNLTATTHTYHSTRLTWNEVADADYYYIWRSTYDGGYKQLFDSGTVPIKVYATEYINDGLPIGKIYYYKVQPIDEGMPAPIGVGPQSSYKYAKADWPALGLTAVSGGYDSVKLNWNDINGADRYQVYYNTSSGGTYAKYGDPIDVSNATVIGLITGKTYYFKIEAIDSVHDAKHLYSYKYAKPIPATPTNIKVVKALATSINITWDAVEGTTGYEVYRATSANGIYTRIADTNLLSASSIGLTVGKTYYYKMRAYKVMATRVYGSFTAPIGLKLV